METKTCPSCGSEVPVAASRCKTCFHDFDEAPPRGNGGPIWILGALALMAMIAAGVFYWRSTLPTDQRILVDKETETVQWVTQFSDGTLKTDRIAFADVVKLEYVIGSTGTHEVVAITTSGDRKVIESHPEKGLQLQAERYAQVMDKPLSVVDNTSSFLD